MLKVDIFRVVEIKSVFYNNISIFRNKIIVIKDSNRLSIILDFYSKIKAIFYRKRSYYYFKT